MANNNLLSIGPIKKVEDFRQQHIVTWTVKQKQLEGQAKGVDPVKLFQDYQKQALQNAIQQNLPDYLRVEVPGGAQSPFTGPIAYVQYYAYNAGLYVFTRVLLFYGIIVVVALLVLKNLFGSKKSA
ncbi:MAG: hypothetical protein ACR2IQ_00295 [Minisyncoccia bacterium]